MIAAILLTLVLAPPPSTGRAPQELPEHRAFQAADVLWQPLPGGVAQVFVGPHDRAWFMMADRPRLTLDDAKRLIERELTEANPRARESVRIFFATAR